MALTDKLKAIANAIRVKTGKTDTLTLDEMPTEIASIETGGGVGGDGAEFARSIVNKTIEAYTDSEITTVGGYSFVDCNKMTSVSVPVATSLGNYAFSSCDTLSNLNIPKVTSVGQYAFNGCIALVSIEGKEVTTLGNYAFNGCTALTTPNFPKVTTVNTYAFQNCSALTEFNGDKVTSVGAYAFTGTAIKHLSFPSLKSMTSNAWRGCPLESIDLPVVTNIANNAFRNCSALTAVTFPKVTSTSSEAMRNCYGLAYVDLPVCASFGTYTFNNATALETLILRKTDKACTMSNVNVLQGTKIASGEGYIYVPSALVDTYKAATNWKTYADQIRAIEDYTVDGTITGEFDLSKIEG